MKKPWCRSSSIGWLKFLTGGQPVNDGKPHTAVLSSTSANVRLWLDGKMVAEKTTFTKPDDAGHVFKVGGAAPNTADDFNNGGISSVRVWARALPGADITIHRF